MVVNYLNPGRARLCPYETDSILVVDAYAVLPQSVSGKGLEPIARWNAQVLQCHRRVELVQFSVRHAPQ